MLRYHVEGFRKAGAKITAVADPASSVAPCVASAWTIPRSFDSVKALLSAPLDLDAISIIVPNNFIKSLLCFT